MTQRRALGRGLSALIPPSQPSADRAPLLPARADQGGPLFIALDRISPNPRQPRKRFDDVEIDRLADSLREQGVLQPLVVRRNGDGYELIIGERRWRAAQRARMKEVPAVVLDASDRGALEMALVENVQRADLNPIELARAFRAFVEEEGMTQEEVARRVAVDRSSVANHLRLLELPAEIQQDLVEERLSMGHAKALLQCPSGSRSQLRDRIVREALSVRASEEVSRRMSDPRSKESKGESGGINPNRDVHLDQLEERLRRALQTKVRIVTHGERGRIEVHFHGGEELDRLASALSRPAP
jgi:ParB family chromosome partitioning protein